MKTMIRHIFRPKPLAYTHVEALAAREKRINRHVLEHVAALTGRPRPKKRSIPFVHRFWSNPLAWGLGIYAGCTTVMALVYLIFFS